MTGVDRPEGDAPASRRAPVRTRPAVPARVSGHRHRGTVVHAVRTSGPLRMTLRDVHVQGRRGPMLHLPGLSLATGECVLVAGEPGQGHTALALVATGRLAPFEGAVRLAGGDGATTADAEVLRRISAVVDLPGISEPDDTLPTAVVVAEELALAGHPSGGGRVRAWLDDHGLARYRDVRMDDLPGAVRTVLLTSLAVERPDVRFLVISLPDRHGGEPTAWWAVAQACAERGYGVLVQSSRSSARELGAELEPARGDESQSATPVETLRTGTDQVAALEDTQELSVDLEERRTPPATGEVDT